MGPIALVKIRLALAEKEWTLLEVQD